MSDEDQSQKTEDPTDRKLSKAKEKGQTGSSNEVKNWVILFGGTLMLAILAPWMMTGVTNMSIIYVEQPETIPVEFDTIVPLFIDISLEMLLYLAPFFAVLMVMALAANLGQSGFLYAPSKIMPDLAKLSPLSGLKRMFSLRSVVEFVKGILKLGVVTVVSYSMAVPLLSEIAMMPDYSISAMLDELFIVAIAISAGATIVMTVVAVLDFLYQKFEFTKSMRMSRQEIKDEYKDSEGDPQIKARIRKLRAQRAQQRMMANVPTADVVITNPTHYAVALSYKMDNMQAPRLVAKGMDSLAFKIREVAEENDVPIVENAPLARALYATVELDEEIPVEHYQAVAEVIGYVMKLKGKMPSGGGQTVD
ncbi:MAG: flagellar biosynthesis protein FlhB [Rhodospirillales bacterium]|nr:flagellar biosynthesis protein FlhB [Rhodospirillales bacterium]